jgi:hypothetical protein
MFNSMNNKHSIRGIFCDLEKAFDCVKRDIRYLNSNVMVFQRVIMPFMNHI